MKRPAFSLLGAFTDLGLLLAGVSGLYLLWLFFDWFIGWYLLGRW